MQVEFESFNNKIPFLYRFFLTTMTFPDFFPFFPHFLLSSKEKAMKSLNLIFCYEGKEGGLTGAGMRPRSRARWKYDIMIWYFRPVQADGPILPSTSLLKAIDVGLVPAAHLRFPSWIPLHPKCQWLSIFACFTRSWRDWRTNGLTNQQTDEQTDQPGYREGRSWLKRSRRLPDWVSDS